MSAPARTMAVTDSCAVARRSSQPRSAAAQIMAYSPDTWYAATGTSETAATSASPIATIAAMK